MIFFFKNRKKLISLISAAAITLSLVASAVNAGRVYAMDVEPAADDWTLSAPVSTSASSSSWEVSGNQLTASVSRVTGSGQAQAVLSDVESLNWTNYAFSADVTVDKSAADTYATVGVRAYAQSNTLANQQNACYEFRSVRLNNGKFSAELYKMYLNKQNSRVPKKLMSMTWEPADSSQVGATSVTYSAKIEAADSMIRCFLDDVCVLEYSTAGEEAAGYNSAYTQGSIGFFICTTGADKAAYTVKLENIQVKPVELAPPEPGEDGPDETPSREPALRSDEDLLVVRIDDFSKDSGTWESKGLDAGNGIWSIENGVLTQSLDSSSLTTVALSSEEEYSFGAVAADVMITSKTTGNIYAGVVGGFRGNKNYYHLRLADKQGTYLLQLFVIREGVAKNLAEAIVPSGLQRNVWYSVEMCMLDGVITGYLDGTKLLEYSLKADENIGTIGSAGVRVSQGSAKFDNFGIKIPRGEPAVEDSFSSETLEGSAWTNENGDVNDNGVWSAANGILTQSNDAANVNTILLHDDQKQIHFGGVSADIRFISENTGNLYAGPVMAYNGAQNYYHLRLGDMKDLDPANRAADKLQLFVMTGGTASKLAETDLPNYVERDKWYNIELFHYNGTLFGYVDGILLLTYTPDAGLLYEDGMAGIRVSQGACQIDNVKVFGAAASSGGSNENITVVDTPMVFTDNFQNEISGTSPEYWLEANTTDFWKVSEKNGQLCYGCEAANVCSVTWLHVFETNVDCSAKLMVPHTAEAQARVGLVVRMSGEKARVRVGYDFSAAKWFIQDCKGADFNDQMIWASETAPFEKGAWNTVRVRAVGKTVEILCNDQSVLKTSQIGQVTTGRVGLFTENCSLYADDFSVSLLSGQGRVEKAALANYILPRDKYTEGASLFWLNDQIALINIDTDLFVSEDQGQTFRVATAEERAQYAFFRQSGRTQYIRLHSGNILKIDNFVGGNAYLSEDNGMTESTVGRLWPEGSLETRWEYYGGMNDMLKEVKLANGNYRVFYCADARATGKADGSGGIIYHWEEIYYSDDEGRTWQKCETDTRPISALDNVCESKIIACADGDLRMYCSWNDSDCVRYYESHDDGLTWEGEYAIPEMQCSRSSFAIMEDPYHPGTTYMVFSYAKPNAWGAVTPRTRLVLARSTDGKNWEFVMDCWRWDDVPDDRIGDVNQIVDPSITITEDYIFVLSGWSEEIEGQQPHNKQRQHILKLNKADLVPYEQWPGTPDAKAIVHVEVTAPTKTKYHLGEAMDLAGGKLQIFYYDGTSEEISIDSKGVEIQEVDLKLNYTTVFAAPDMSVEGEKIIRVTYLNFADTFCITVSAQEDRPIPPAPAEVKRPAEVKLPAEVHVFFIDTEETDWFFDSVIYVARRGIMKGTGNNLFSPEQPFTRAMLMTMLARLDGVNTEGGATWYEKGLRCAAENGISDGTVPESPVTREQFVTMLCRYAGAVADGNVESFSDYENISDWALAAVKWAVSNGIMLGYDGRLNPQGNVTRAETAVMMMRFCERINK